MRTSFFMVFFAMFFFLSPLKASAAPLSSDDTATVNCSAGDTTSAVSLPDIFDDGAGLTTANPDHHHECREHCRRQYHHCVRECHGHEAHDCRRRCERHYYHCARMCH